MILIVWCERGQETQSELSEVCLFCLDVTTKSNRFNITAIFSLGSCKW